MKYLELEFTINPYNRDAADLLTALAADAGLESFVDTPQGFKGYAQKDVFDPQALDAIIEAFPMEGIAVTYQVADAEDKNWNEEWERNGFEPILIAGDIFVHSTRHAPLPTAEYDITINPRQAFGTGTHQTTDMSLEILLGMDLEGRTVADAGCGTGILGIFCALKGAEHVFGYDVDNWSVENTKENMRLNGVSQMEAVEGNSAVLQGKGTFDIVLANINRNILLADLPAFRSALSPQGKLILSGFYTEDCPLLIGKAETLGLACTRQTEKDGWAALLLEPRRS